MIGINALVILFQNGWAGSHLAIWLAVRGLVLGGNVARDWRSMRFICSRRPTDVAD